MGVTLRYAFFATAIEMVLGMIIALLLNHENAFSRFLRLVLIFPLMIAPVIGALIWPSSPIHPSVYFAYPLAGSGSETSAGAPIRTGRSSR